MNMLPLGHTPASYLSKEYFNCLQTYEDARQQICMLAIELYHAEVSPQLREVKFKVLEDETDAYEANRANVKKVDGYFQTSRSANLPFSFAHFIGRAIDKLYGRDVVEQICKIMIGPKAHAPGANEALPEHTQKFSKESGEVIQKYLALTSKGLDNLTREDKLAMIKELDDVQAITGKFMADLEISAGAPVQ